MLDTAIAFTRYYAALLFGLALASELSGMERSARNILALFGFSALLFALQLVCESVWGMDFTIRIYPLLTHLPVAFWIALYLRRPWLIALSSLFLSYLCCQPARWIGAAAGELLNSAAVDHIAYVAVSVLLFFLLKKYVVASARHLMTRSVKSCLLFCTVPAALYYLLSFVGTVYTDFVFSGSRAAVQFTPFVATTFYFVFLFLYYAETQKQSAIQRERDILYTQLKHAQNELAALRETQQISAAYRHDMRHHLTLLQGLAAEERIGEIQEYLHAVQSDIDAITPKRYCANETVNLILSSFAQKAAQENIALDINAALPSQLPFTDTEICSLLSNALENAIHAAKPIPDAEQRMIRLRMYSKNSKLCIDIKNRYLHEPLLHQGLPVSNGQGHGFGTRSMVRIVEKHYGVYQFLVKDGWFIFQASV